MSAKKKTTAKKAAAKPAKVEAEAAPAPEPAKDKNLKPASWLVARLRNALHKSQPDLKEKKTLQGVSTLSDLRTALGMSREEWESLLEKFFNLGGTLEEKKA